MALSLLPTTYLLYIVFPLEHKSPTFRVILRLSWLLIAAIYLGSLIGCAAISGGHRFVALQSEVIPLPTPDRLLSSALTESPMGPILSWLEHHGFGMHSLRYSIFRRSGWSEPATVITEDRFWINWADTPGVTAFEDGTLIAYWLRRSGEGNYDYEIRVALKAPGAPWGESFLLHDDNSPLQHGFVSSAQINNGIYFLWLDERSGTIALHGRELAATGTAAKELVFDMAAESSLDEQTCSCCRLAVATLPDDNLLVAYRDRSDQEIRDISLQRYSDESGWRSANWSSGDGWQIAGCPVNGPDIVATGSAVALAWFTAAGDQNRLKLTLSADAGVTFSAPIRIDAGDPIGRPSLLMNRDGSVLVVWLEQTESGTELLSRVVDSAGVPAPPQYIAPVKSGFLAGYPKIVEFEGVMLIYWPDGDAVNMVRIKEMN